MIAAVLDPRRGHAAAIELNPTLEHLADTVESLGPVGCGRLVRLVLDDITHGDKVGVLVRSVAPRMIVTDATHAHDTDLQFCHLSLPFFVVS